VNKPTINILDPATANLIAAGEVVDRPAAVVKELVENSLDAGAAHISVEIIRGGLERIRVSDDGQGMNRWDAQLCLLRHATSKVSSPADLNNIRTMGFRGEALPSIAAVSKLEILTKAADADLATIVRAEGGKLLEVTDAGGPSGTTVTVTELFFNTPARKKFLKSVSVEAGHIHDVLAGIAMTFPGISFRLVNNSRLVLWTPGDGNLINVLTAIYGQEIAAKMLPVTFSAEGITISGYTGRPDLYRSSRQWETLAVNSRLITSRTISSAIERAYHSLLPQGTYPVTVINIEFSAVNGESPVDVNVHPQKKEIKFANEKAVFSAVYRAIDLALQNQAIRPSEAPSGRLSEFVKKENEKKENKPAMNNLVDAPADVLLDRPVDKSHGEAMIYLPPSSMPTAWESASTYGHVPPPAPEKETGLIPLGQIDDCYIVAKSAREQGLFVIDQHAAHERIIYQRLYQNSGRIPAQQLLIPPVLRFSGREAEVLTENADILEELGYKIEQVGPTAVKLLELPADIPSGTAENMVGEIAALLIKSGGNSGENAPGMLRHAILQTTACHAAIKAGERLTLRQMQFLLDELAATDTASTCPHGRPTIVRISSDSLAKLFHRT